MNAVIQTDNLTKCFGSFCAVNKINIQVNKGEIYSFIGLNGSGKTTTIRMLLGMCRPTEGEAYLWGNKVSAKNTDIWKRVGYLVEIPYSYPELTVKENLEIVRILRKIDDPYAVEDVLSKFKLNSYKDRKVSKLSNGNAQRLGLAKALIHKPEILFLDEPTNGLDPAGIVEIREMLLDLARNHGVTIFISSHILGEVSRLADRIGIIHEGNLVQEMDADKIDMLRRKTLLVGARDIGLAKTTLLKNGFSVEADDDGYLLLSEERALEKPDEISSLLVSNGCPPTVIRPCEEDLELLFFRVISGKGGMMK